MRILHQVIEALFKVDRRDGRQLHTSGICSCHTNRLIRSTPVFTRLDHNRQDTGHIWIWIPDIQLYVVRRFLGTALRNQFYFGNACYFRNLNFKISHLLSWLFEAKLLGFTTDHFQV
ncbi:hypothetical protein D3C71_1478500 [compost metagenome]